MTSRIFFPLIISVLLFGCNEKDSIEKIDKAQLKQLIENGEVQKVKRTDSGDGAIYLYKEFLSAHDKSDKKFFGLIDNTDPQYIYSVPRGEILQFSLSELQKDNYFQENIVISDDYYIYNKPNLKSSNPSWVIILIVVAILYLIPSTIAYNKKDSTAIIALNILLGWTFLGWVIALIWALTKDKEIIYEQTAPIPSSGNNEKTSGIAEEIKNLNELKKQGILSEQEFQQAKNKILSR